MNSAPAPQRGSDPSVVDLNKLIDSYVALRDRRRAIEDKHKSELEPYKKIMEELEQKLLAVMQASGVDSVSTRGGTAYQKTRLSATIKDGTAFRAYVIQNQAFDLVDWRANANAVFEHIEDNNGVPPPGVNPSTYISVGVRRPNEKE
jgi:hypothetical protein